MNQPLSSNNYNPSISRAYALQILHPQPPPIISKAIPMERNNTQMANLNNKTRYQQVIKPSSDYYVPPYFLPPAYLVQAIPIEGRSPQNNFTLNFDTETANTLCDGKINQDVILCVVCQSEYKVIDQQQHIKKHKRRIKISPIKDHLTDKLAAYRMVVVKAKKEYIVKPIVEPEECTIQYEPKMYNLKKKVDYEDPQFVEKQSKAIGVEEDSFSLYDQNMTLNNNSMNYAPNRFIKTEANPFINKRAVLHPSDLPILSISERQPAQSSKQSKGECIYAHDATLNRQQFSFENGPIVCEPINDTRGLVHRLQSFSDPTDVKDQVYSFSRVNGSITHLLKEESFSVTEKGQMLP